MADIFLSYNREDQAVARRFAEAFEAQGLSVWWGATLRSGEAYDQVTEKALSHWQGADRRAKRSALRGNRARARLVDCWRASGNWGDFARPVGTDDFECW
jgi:TIR domain